MERLPDEKTCDFLGRLSVGLAEAAITARADGDDVHAAFFAIKAAETLKLARYLGYRPERVDKVEG